MHNGVFSKILPALILKQLGWDFAGIREIVFTTQGNVSALVLIAQLPYAIVLNDGYSSHLEAESGIHEAVVLVKEQRSFQSIQQDEPLLCLLLHRRFNIKIQYNWNKSFITGATVMCLLLRRGGRE